MVRVSASRFSVPGQGQADTSTLDCTDQTVTLLDLPNLKTPTAITQARYVQSICTRTIWVPPTNLKRNSKAQEPCPEDQPIRVSILVIGARKKVHVLTYVSGKPHTVREITLPHTPRLMLFPAGAKPWASHEKGTTPAPTIHLHYNANDWGILEVDLFSNEKGSAAGLKLSEPPAATCGPSTATGTAASTAKLAMTASSGSQDKAGASGGGLGVGAAFGGLGGYVGKGFRAVSGASTAVNSIVGVGVGSDYFEEADPKAEDGRSNHTNGEALVIRVDQGVFYDGMGRLTETAPIDLSGDPPDDLVFSDPYIISAIPSTSQNMPSRVEIRLKQTLAVQQDIALGGNPVDPDTPAAATTGSGHLDNAAVRCLSVSTRTTSDIATRQPDHGPLSAVWVAVPQDKLQLQTEGSVLWCLRGEPWKAILDDTLKEGRFEDGQGLLKAIQGRQVKDVETVSGYGNCHIRVLLIQTASHSQIMVRNFAD